MYVSVISQSLAIFFSGDVVFLSISVEVKFEFATKNVVGNGVTQVLIVK